MMRLFLVLEVLALLASPALAADQVRWGEPVNGLRLGLVDPPSEVASDQRVTFRVEVQNVSSQTIVLPTPGTFVLKPNPQSDDYHESSLVPVVEQAPLVPVSTPIEASSIVSTSGPPIAKLLPHLVVLAPNQAITWDAQPLEKQYYVGDRLGPDGKSTVENYVLLPNFLLEIRFRFENEQKRIVEKGVWTGLANSGVADVKVDSPSTAGIKLEGGFSIPKQIYFLGEAITATFVVTNKGQDSISFPTGGDYRGSGRHDRFSVSAVDAQGKPVPDPVPRSGMGGGLGSDVRISFGGSYTETVLVNQWCAFSKPGSYKVTLGRTLHVIASNSPGLDIYLRPETSLPAVPIETKLDLVIEDNPLAEKKYFATLLRLPSSNYTSASRQPYDLLRSDAQARLPAAFLVITQLLDGPLYSQVQGVQCLACYGSEKAARVLLARAPHLAPQARELALRTLSEWNAPEVEPLIAAALRDRNSELRANTVLICSNKLYASCVPLLLTMYTDPDLLVRRYLGAALGASSDPRAVPVLLKLLHDTNPDPFIKIWAADGLGKFKRMEGVPVMIALLRDPKARSDDGNVMMTLKTLTGQDFQENRNAYLSWWKKTGRDQYGKL